MTRALNFVAVGRSAILQSTKHESKIADIFTFYPPSYRFSPKYKQKIWDGKIHMLNNHTIPIGVLRAAEVRKELADLGFEPHLRKWIDRPKCSLRKGFNEANKKYEHQNECVTAMLHALSYGGGLILSAVGTGKTKTAAQFFSWVDEPCLFVVDEKALLYQAADEIKFWLNKEVPSKKGWTIGIVGDSKFEPNVDGVTIATIQTLHKHRNKKAFRKWYKQLRVVVIDELHVQMARRNFKVLDSIRPAAVYGLTATLQLKRKDVRMKAYALCGPVIFTFPVTEGMRKGVLSKGVAIELDIEDDSLPIKVPMQGMPIRMRTKIIAAAYADAVTDNVLANRAVFALVRQALKKGYYCIVLVDRLAHLHFFEKHFTNAGFKPKLCFGAVDVKDRKKIIDKFDAGKARLIIANQVFKKGVNIKRADLIIDAAQRGNKNDAMQKFGRGVRLHSDKDGLIFVHIATLPRMQKAAKSRYNAFKAAKIPVAKTNKVGSVLALGESMLSKILKSKGVAK